ncbi:MAG: PhoU domain-containing protein [Cutibacterium avidum]|nr:PhoU domain-containing protein [Cutibacterium avidum]
MRESYHDELNATSGRILTMAELVRVAVKDATEALIGADLTTAERVISDDSKVDALNEEIERRCFDLLARQAPVAGELRTVVAVLRMCYELARMGDLAAHVAKIARLRFPEVAVPPQVADQFVEMSRIADSRRDQFRLLLGDDWTYGVESAVDTALLGRYYERIADHAVAVGSRVIYIVTGKAPAGEDWPSAY